MPERPQVILTVSDDAGRSLGITGTTAVFSPEAKGDKAVLAVLTMPA